MDAGDRHDTVTKIAAVLAASGRYYSRGGMLSRLAILQAEETDKDGTKRAAGSITIKSAEVQTIVSDVSKTTIVKKWDGRKRAHVKADLPVDVAQSVKETAAETPSIKGLLGIVHVPILRPDGSMMALRGYDPVTRLYLAADVELNVPDRPTMKDAKAAAKWLMDEIYGEFNTNEIGKSVMLSSLLTAILRPYLGGSPLHAFSAPSWGAGKSMCAEIAGIVAMGVVPAMIPPGETKEETMKRVESAIRSGDAINVLDNVSHPLTGDALCVMLTAQIVSIRIFGTNTIAKFESAAFWMVTGQNLQIGGDLVRRSVIATIDPGVERPELSEFKKSDLVGWVKKNRLLILEKIFLILRAHAQAGFPHGEGAAPRLGSFGDWSKRVAGLLTWLGYVSPKASQEALYDEDPARQRRVAVLDAIYDWQQGGLGGTSNTSRTKAGKPWAMKELFEMATSDNSGHHVLADFVKSDLKYGATAHTLGNWLRRIKGQVTDGKRLVQSGIDPSDKVALWLVEEVAASSVVPHAEPGFMPSEDFSGGSIAASNAE